MPALNAQFQQLCHSDSPELGPIRDVLDRISNKWSLLIMAMLEDAPMRFGALHSSVPGISQRMLTLTLRSLQRDGLVFRTAYAETPPRVEYEVTDLGRTLLPVVALLGQWAFEHRDELESNQDTYDLALES